MICNPLQVHEQTLLAPALRPSDNHVARQLIGQFWTQKKFHKQFGKTAGPEFGSL
jgi:hypothetical protein